MRLKGHNVKPVTAEELDQILSDDSTPVLVDFCWSPWCLPCQQFMATLVKEAERYRGLVRFCAADLVASPELAATYQIKAAPTLVFFRDGEPTDRLIGLSEPEEVEQFVRGNLDKG